MSQYSSILIGLLSPRVLDGRRLMIWIAVIIAKLHKCLVGLIEQLRSPIFLSAKPFCWGVYRHDVSCLIPSLSKNSFNSRLQKSLALSVLKPLISTTNYLLTKWYNFCRMSFTYVFCLSMNSQPNLMWSSMQTRNHLKPFMSICGDGPHISQWMSWNGEVHILFSRR